MGAQFSLFGSREEYRRRPSSLLLRPYQVDAVERIRGELNVQRSTLLVMATGLGKTVTFGEIAKAWPGRVLILAHREELLDQARKKIEEMTGELVELEQAEWRAHRGRIVVASVATLRQEHRQAKFLLDPFSLVIIDEAHHAPAKSYRTILEAFPGAKVLGVTATPDRKDGKALGRIFDSVAFTKDIGDGIEDGYLCPIRLAPVRVEEVNLSKVKVHHGDFAQDDLDAAMAEAVAPIAKVAIEQAGDRRALIFTPGVKTARALAETLNKLRAGSARSVDGETPKQERKWTLDAHKRGEIQFLANCGVLVEGYDDPAVSCIVMARPTRSRSLYAQMAGRGLRILPVIDGEMTAEARRAAVAASTKPDCLILDICGNSDEHKLVSPIDILGGRYTDKERELAKTVAAAKPGMMADEALEDARRRIKDEQRRAADLASKAEVKYKVSNTDPFKILGLDGGDRKMTGEPASASQIARLQKWKIDVPASCTSSIAEKLIRTEATRRRYGFCTYGQQRLLQRYGYETKSMKIEPASRLITAIGNNGWKRISAQASEMAISVPEPGWDG